MECVRNAEGPVLDLNCELTRITPTRASISLEGTLSEPIYSLWVHVIFFKQISPTEYRKFLVDLWEGKLKKVAINSTEKKDVRITKSNIFIFR